MQPGGLPIWLASNNYESGLKRVARLGDGWLNNIKSPETYREYWEKIRAYATEAGRNRDRARPLLYLGRGREGRGLGRSDISRPILQSILRGGGRCDAVRCRVLERSDRWYRKIELNSYGSARYSMSACRDSAILTSRFWCDVHAALIRSDAAPTWKSKKQRAAWTTCLDLIHLSVPFRPIPVALAEKLRCLLLHRNSALVCFFRFPLAPNGIVVYRVRQDRSG
ncbi:MAG: LLM class flavin-dependent oxidoreductase [Betaproteobacteria bacterium]|nr:LLM class flavin-dependent oxidoreductase [Betaproteobacteria bacterium]